MDFSGTGLTYIFLTIPSLFAVAVIGQGAYKLVRREEGGVFVLGLGVVFAGLIAGAYFLFIR